MIYLYLFGTCFHFIYVFMIIGNYWSTTINDNIGGKVTVTFVKHYGGWNLLSTDY